jgi:hypothetical protein
MHTDNLTAVIEGIALVLRASPLIDRVKDADATVEEFVSRQDFSMEYRMTPDSWVGRVTLTARCESGFRDEDHVTEADGSCWRRMALKVSVGWGSNGNGTITETIQQANLIRDVALLAQDVEQTFVNVAIWSCVQTAAEAAEAKVAYAKRAAQKKADMAIVQHCRGMRVDEVRNVFAEDHGIPAGLYGISNRPGDIGKALKGKHFTLRAIEPSGLVITRRESEQVVTTLLSSEAKRLEEAHGASMAAAS